MALFGFKKKEKEEKVAERETALAGAGKEEVENGVVSAEKETNSDVPKKQAVRKLFKRKGEVRR